MAKKLMDTLIPRPNAADLDRIAEQIFSATPPSLPVPPAPPALVNPKNAAPAKRAVSFAEEENAQHRLTIDLPKWLVERLKSDGKRNGITVRGMILANLLETYKE